MGRGRREAPIAVGAGGAKGRRGQFGAIEGQFFFAPALKLEASGHRGP